MLFLLLKQTSFLACLLAAITLHVYARPETLTLLFAGDVMGNKPQINAAYNPDTDTYDYKPCFMYAKPIIEQADIAIANLELTLPGAPPYTGFPMFRSPDAVAEALKYAGFDVLVTANNHSNDSGLQGVVNTIETLKTLGFSQTGTFKDSSDRAQRCPLIMEKNGITFALLNYTFHTNGLATPAPTKVNRIDRQLIKADIAAAQNQGAEFIIGFFHWGEEYKNYENAYQREWAQTAADMGMDLIIGAHPHVVQPIKMLAAKLANGTQKQVPVVYSLGNFISNAISTNTSMGLIVETTLQRNPLTCQIAVSQINYLPSWRYLETKTVNKRLKNTYYALPASAFYTDAYNVLQMPPAALNQLHDAMQLARRVLAEGTGTERHLTLQHIFGEETEAMVCKAIEKRQTNTIALQKTTKPAATATTLQQKTTGNAIAPPAQTTLQATDATTSGITYKIQFLATRSDKTIAHPFTDVTIEQNSQGWYRYLSGRFTSMPDAQKHLQKVKLKGYDQAFIAIYENGKRKN